MKIAITGGAGFIGSRLAKTLKDEGHELVLFDLHKAKIFPESSQIVDITDKDALIKSLEGVDAIYHLAAEHRDDVSPVQRYYDVNVEGAKNIVDAAKAHNINTIIFTSTVAVYGLGAGNTEDPSSPGSRETDTPAPFNDYGKSKLEGEEVFEEWANADAARKLVTLRLVATFGPGNRGNIYTLMNQISRGKFVMVGSGRNHKSIAYVENVAAFLKHCLSFELGTHLYNYADKPDLSMRSMVGDIRGAMNLSGLGPKIPYPIGLIGGITFDLAAKLTGKTFPISAIRVQKFCADTVVNADKLGKTGFKAPHSLQDGLKDMIEQDFPKQEKAA